MFGRAETADRQYGQTEWRLIVMACALYLTIVTVFLMVHGGWTTPDLIVPALFFFALALGRGKAFLADWVPFLFIVLSYEEASGIAYKTIHMVHSVDVIALEQRLFGAPIPSIRLQQRFYHPNGVMPWDVLAACVYLLHFAVPVGVGFWIFWQAPNMFEAWRARYRIAARQDVSAIPVEATFQPHR